ncbi:hypothetical protein [Aquirhabdus parva]|uniref:Uncharacterized protein n=1 Tax=Aquirhabdus parva TaxID=2283318 RepID=A0A345P4W8_9GAMM|nr:hypothetical protein [Aquirhabdus parva]AXI02327.1 hypothetical protein HYN46_05440 [Aquirhabdus parva]
MSTLDIVHAYEKSPLGQFFISIDNVWVIIFQIVHVFSILTVLTAIIVLAFHALGLLPIGESNERLGKLFFKVTWIGVIGAIVSGSLLFLTSATHYFTNRAFPIKLILLVGAIVVQFVIFKRFFLRKPSYFLSTKVVAVLSVFLWFATGFAGRAIGFV